MKHLLCVFALITMAVSFSCSKDDSELVTPNYSPVIYSFFPDLTVINTKGSAPDSTGLNVSAEDPDGEIASYEFTIILDESGGTLTGDDTANGKIYKAGTLPGFVTIKVTVTDDRGSSEDEVVTFEVQAPAASMVNADLSGITSSEGTLLPAFNKNIKDYYVNLPLATDEITVTPTAAAENATIVINGSEIVSSGAASSSVTLTDESYIITIEVISGDENTTKTYTVKAHKIYYFHEYGYYAYIDGTYSRTANEYLSFDPTITSGVYRIKPYNVINPFDIRCDMTTDGGGWMMVGFMGMNIAPTSMFSDSGSVVTNFSENLSAGSWSININNNLLKGSEPLTEMAITLDEIHTTISAYETNNKVVYYQWGTYIVSNWYGANESGTFSVRLNAADAWNSNTSWYNSGGTPIWYPALNGAYLSLMNNGGLGFYWGVGMGGNNSWNHWGYVWVR